MASGPAPQSPACGKGSSADPGETPPDRSLLSACKAMGRILHLLGAMLALQRGIPLLRSLPTPWKGTRSRAARAVGVLCRHRAGPIPVLRCVRRGHPHQSYFLGQESHEFVPMAAPGGGKSHPGDISLSPPPGKTPKAGLSH